MRDQGPRPSGSTYEAVITDVDCTPRPRYLESREAFETRMAREHATGSYAQAAAQAGRLNRNAALRAVAMADGATQYHTQCACKWHGLRVSDPEVARREYDAHACTITGEVGQTLRRTGEPLTQAWIDETKAQLTADQADLERTLAVLSPPAEYTSAPVVTTTDADGLEQRVALLEVK